MTIGLKSVENPLEFGIVVTDEDGRVERFLEKPSWGQVFSDTINTGIYVLEPEVLRHVPTDRPYDFSKELFPLLLEMGRPIYGYVCEGYWQDIGNLDQYRQANFDALDEKVALEHPRPEDPRQRVDRRGRRDRRRRGRRGPGVHRQLLHGSRPTRRSARTRCSAPGVTLRERARVSRSVIDASRYIGRSARRRGRDPRPQLRRALARTRARGRRDRRPGDARRPVRDLPRRPHLPVQGGRVRRADPREPDLGVARRRRALFGKDGVTGLVNVDLTPEVAVRLGAALGTALKRGARVVASRECAAGLPHDQARDHLRPQLDRRRTSPTCARCRRRRQALAEHAELRRRLPRRRVAARPGGGADQPLRAPGHRALGRACRRRSRSTSRARSCAASPFDEVGSITYPARARESYAQRPARRPRRRRDPRARLPHRRRLRLLGGVAPSCRSCSGRSASRRSRRTRSTSDAVAAGARCETIDQAKRLVAAVGADLGAVFDRSAERLYLIDERGREVPRRPGAAALPPPDRLERPAGKRRRPGDRRRARSRSGRRGPRGRAHARLARRS